MTRPGSAPVTAISGPDLPPASGRPRKPRILLVNSAMYIGGAEHVIATLCRHIDRSRFEVTVAHLKGDGPIARDLVREGYDVVGLSRATEHRRDLGTVLRLRRLVNERRVDIVHSHDLHSLVNSTLCAVTLGSVRHVSTIHFGNYPRKGRRHHHLERLFLKFPDAVVAVGEAQRSSVEQAYHLGRGRLSLVRNGVAGCEGEPSAEVRTRVRRDAPLVIAAVSTLTEQKGIDDLLHVARRLLDRNLDFRLAIVGDGPDRTSLEQLSARLGLGGQVEFLGWIERAGAVALPCADIFIQTSRWEAMSLVVLEAMAGGLPIVATSVGENCHVIRDGENGLLVAPGDLEAITEKLTLLLRSAEIRQRMGAVARCDWERNYTAERMCRDYEALYMSVLNKGAVQWAA